MNINEVGELLSKHTRKNSKGVALVPKNVVLTIIDCLRNKDIVKKNCFGCKYNNYYYNKECEECERAHSDKWVASDEK